MAENGEGIPQVEPQNKQNHMSIHFFPGFGANHSGWEVATKELHKLSGIDKVVTENSVLFSKDAPEVHRYAKIGDRLLETYKNYDENGQKGKVIIGMNSGGGGEFAQVWKYLMKKNPELIKKHIQDTEFLVIGTAGIEKGLKGAWTLRSRLGELSKAQLGAFKEEPSEIAGIETLFMFNSPNIKDEVLTSTLRKLYPERTNLQEDSKTINYTPHYGYYEQLSKEMKEKLDKIDEQINLFSEKVQIEGPLDNNLQTMTKLLKDRAMLLNPLAEQVWNSGVVVKERERAVLSLAQKFAIPFLSFADQASALKAIIVGDTGKILNRLLKDGMSPSQINYIVPEYDVLVTYKDLLAGNPIWTEEELKKRTTIMERGTHASWAPIGEPLARAVQMLYSNTHPAS